MSLCISYASKDNFSPSATGHFWVSRERSLRVSEGLEYLRPYGQVNPAGGTKGLI
jgi:hypothetical protein